MKNNLREKLLPFVLTVSVIVADQITKYFIAKTIPMWGIGAYFFGDMNDALVRIIHVANTGVAFSVGATWSETVRKFMFSLTPLVVLIVVTGVYFRNNAFTKLQRWCIAGVIGGGLGNLIDRFFRPDGVIDFIDIKFFGIFGLDRWPTFNVADATVVVCGTLLIISFAQTMKNEDAKKEVA